MLKIISLTQPQHEEIVYFLLIHMVISVLYLVIIFLDSDIKARKFEPNRILKESRQQPHEK